MKPDKRGINGGANSTSAGRSCLLDAISSESLVELEACLLEKWRMMRMNIDEGDGSPNTKVLLARESNSQTISQSLFSINLL